MVGRPDQLAPLGRAQLGRRVEVDVIRRRRHLADGERADGGRAAVEVRVDYPQLLVIMGVRMLVAELVFNCAVWVVRVVHARPQVRVVERSVLVIEAECVADLLAHHEVSPRGGVVFRGVKVRVVELGDALRDVEATDPDLSQAEPAVIAVGGGADLHASAGGLAVLRPGHAARDHRGVQHHRLAPIGRRGTEIRIPSGRHVVTEVQAEWVARARPMVTAPRMIRKCEGWERGKCQRDQKYR